MTYTWILQKFPLFLVPFNSDACKSSFVNLYAVTQWQTPFIILAWENIHHRANISPFSHFSSISFACTRVTSDIVSRLVFWGKAGGFILCKFRFGGKDFTSRVSKYPRDRLRVLTSMSFPRMAEYIILNVWLENGLSRTHFYCKYGPPYLSGMQVFCLKDVG